MWFPHPASQSQQSTITAVQNYKDWTHLTAAIKRSFITLSRSSLRAVTLKSKFYLQICCNVLNQSHSLDSVLFLNVLIKKVTCERVRDPVSQSSDKEMGYNWWLKLSWHGWRTSGWVRMGGNWDCTVIDCTFLFFFSFFEKSKTFTAYINLTRVTRWC